MRGIAVFLRNDVIRVERIFQQFIDDVARVSQAIERTGTADFDLLRGHQTGNFCFRFDHAKLFHG